MKTEKKLHRLLARQLRRVGVDPGTPPDAEQWANLLKRVERTYAGNEEDRYLLERSLDISSSEMAELYEKLRLATESKITAERDRLKSILTALGDGLCVLDRYGCVMGANPAAAWMLGAPEQSLIGSAILSRFAMLPSDDEHEDVNELLDAQSSGDSGLHSLAVLRRKDHDPDNPLPAVLRGKSLRFERAKLNHPDGNPSTPVSCALSPLLQNDEVTGCVFLFRDMTRERKAESRLHELTMRLKEAHDTAVSANESKSQFLARMSHELRTPLNAVIGYSELLAEEVEMREIPELLPDIGHILASSSGLLQVINEVLDISKIESGKMEVFVEEFDLDELVDDVVTTARPLISRNNNQFVVARGSLLGQVSTDRTKLRQALLNLLSNAAKFTRDGECRLHAERFNRGGAPWVRFVVSDSGVGITTEQLEALFEAYTQAERSTSRKFGGTGLGLAITRHFCRMIGGDVTATSAPGAGSTFTIEVPARANVESCQAAAG